MTAEERDTTSWPDQIRNFLLFITVFVSSLVLFRQPFEAYIGYFIFLLFVPSFLSRFGLSREMILILGAFFVVGMFHIFLGSNDFGSFVKIFLGVGMSYLFYQMMVEYYDRDVDRIMELFVKGSFIVAVIGLLQFVSIKVGFVPGYDYSWILNKWAVVFSDTGGFRLNSIFGEPSQYGITLAPAVFIVLSDFFKKEDQYTTWLQRGVILFTYILTFSTVAYVSILVALFLIFFNKFNPLYMLIPLPLVFLIGVVMYNKVPAFKQRIDSSLMLFSTGDFRGYEINQSSFVQYNNFHVTMENFKNHPFTGTGLGSHESAFDKYTLTRFVGVLPVEFNKQDANSMFLRLLSETGLMGVGLFLFVMIRFYVRKTGTDEIHWVISNACLVIILLYLLRQGHYFINGFPLFVWVYVYNYHQHKKKLRGEIEGEEEETGMEEAEEPKVVGGMPVS